MKNIFFRTFTLFLKASPLRVIAVITITILSGILPSLRIFISMNLINIIAESIQTSIPLQFSEIFNLLAIWVMVTLVSELSSTLQNTLNTIITEKFSISILNSISEKLIVLDDVSFFENKENLVKIDMIREQIHIRPQNYVFNISINLQKIVNLISMVGVLLAVDYLLPILMLCSTVPIFIISQISGKKQWLKTQSMQQEKLKLTTYIKHGLESEKAKDNLLFGFTENFKSAYIKTRDEYLKKIIHIAHRGAALNIFISFVSAVLMAALFFAVIFIIVKKRIAVGALAAYIQAFMYSQYEIQDLATYGKWYFILMGYFKNFFDIIDWKKRETRKVSTNEKIIFTEKIESLEIRNLWFSYDKKEYIIKNLSLFLDAKKTYALVGKNGSGKTTLVKLLLGFYTPQRGSIIINGKYDLSQLDKKTYRQGISAMFQDFGIYAGYTIDENIFIKPEHSKEEEKTKKEKLKFLGIEFKKRLENKENTYIGTQYGGEELSGGEKQRLAALRAFTRTSNCMFFDEPTSAIDPISENEFIETIFKQSAGKIVLIITHRMSSVKSCDKILVIDSGMLIEKGTFDSLIKQNGLFTELYESQRKNFE